MPQLMIPPGLDSVRSGLAPFSAEQVALADLMTMARAVEHEADGPTVAALRMMVEAFYSKDDGFRARVIDAVLTAALLEASRG